MTEHVFMNGEFIEADKAVLPVRTHAFLYGTSVFEGIRAYYNKEELDTLFKVSKGDPMELAIILAAFYGLRRSEVVGLKWSAIDFERKTITIKYTVTEVNLNDGRGNVLIEKERTKFR